MICFVGVRLGVRLHELVVKIWNFITNLNLFATTTHDVKQVHRQRITTRVFIPCLVISLTVLTFYQWTTIQIKTITVQNPTQEKYDQLYENHHATLRCLCSQPFVPYSTFIRITPRLHQVCSSSIISSTWYTPLALVNGTGQFSTSRFWPNFGSSYFQLLESFCSLVQTTINDTYRVFSVNVYTSELVVSRSVISAQAREFSNLYIKSTETETNRSFSFIRDTTYLNQFLTEKMNNFRMFVYLNGDVEMAEASLGRLIPSNPEIWGWPCPCISVGSECGMYPFFATAEYNEVYVLSLIIRCFPVDSVLSSTLECWYDPDCMTLVRDSYSWVGVRGVMNISLLDKAIGSRFPITTTIEVLMQALFLENWTVSFSYEQYYNTCAPTSCSYTTEQQFDLFLVIVTAVAVYGGLSDGLHLIIPLLVFLFLLLLQYLRASSPTAVQSFSSMETHEHPGKNRASLCYSKLCWCDPLHFFNVCGVIGCFLH